MPIAKGEPWGGPGVIPPGAPIVDTDHAASRMVEYWRAKGMERQPIGLTGGDLWRTLGAPAGGTQRLREGPATQVVVDVGWVHIDQSELEHAFVAHCVVRTPLWTRALALMNAEWLGSWDIAPRSHPGDGWLDQSQAALSWTEIRKVRKRLPTGTHLPHPDIQTSKVRQGDFEFDRPQRVYIDGTAFPKVRSLKVRLEPASLTVLV